MELKVNEINTTALAFVGDAVYEIYVRTHVLKTGQTNADRLHQMAVKYVRADGQAKAVKYMMNTNFLTEEEIALVKRARNHKTTSKPRHADPVIYKLSTAFESLLGSLYLAGKTERMEEIISKAIEITQ